MEGAELVGKLQARGKEIKQYDKLFDMDVRYFEKRSDLLCRRYASPNLPMTSIVTWNTVPATTVRACPHRKQTSG